MPNKIDKSATGNCRGVHDYVITLTCLQRTCVHYDLIILPSDLVVYVLCIHVASNGKCVKFEVDDCIL